VPTDFPERRDGQRPPDGGPPDHEPAKTDGLLSNLTLTIGSLMLRCKLEIERIEAGPSAIKEAQAWPRIREELRRIVRLASSGSSPAFLSGLRSTPDQDRHSRSDQREPRASRRRDAHPVSFWAALDPTEREAFRSVAISRTFAAGARLIKEGDPADHVIVILSGRTRICVEDNGGERILAERGPGQLVGERGALQISVRSASVVALETVRALVVRTGDFAAFISAHPRVLAIVEGQVYDRLAEDPTGYGQDGFRHSEYLAPHPQPLIGENCTIILSDVVRFGSRTRTDEDRRVIREALYSITHTALQDLPDVWSWDDRGDGLLTVVPPSVPTAEVIAHLHKELPAAVEEHNRAHREPARIRLRVAINVGPVTTDTMGVTGEAIIVTARLVEAPLFKEAMDKAQASLGVIASTFIYESVIRHDLGLTGYSQIRVDVKESSLTAWMKLFDRPRSSP
jgi:CRP-like cAMP-binding protein